MPHKIMLFMGIMAMAVACSQTSKLQMNVESFKSIDWVLEEIDGSAVVDMGADEAPEVSSGWTTASTIPGTRTTRQELDASHTLNVLAMLLLPVGALALYRRRSRN